MHEPVSIETEAGVDEAGRGPLAGPVVAAAVILPAQGEIDGLADSKSLSAPQRERLVAEIRRTAMAWGVAAASVAEIDRFNILQASLLAMRRAVARLAVIPHLALVDGNQCPKLMLPMRAIVNGDALVPAISAASIMAKVYRDHVMERLHRRYPQYGFASHKGYATAAHLRALRKFGPCPLHRRSFAPVRELLLQPSLPGFAHDNP
jgi:ribonuclease HII